MMEDMKVEPYFNWVKARSACSLERVFIVLAEVIDSDVKTANELPAGSLFGFTRPEGKIIVTRNSTSPYRSIVFELTAANITVRQSTKEGTKDMFVAHPSLTPNRECRLEVDGEPLELWQVSRMALEGLFFGK